MPSAPGVHWVVNGAVLSVPMARPLAKNWTLAMVPSGSLAVAARVAPEPTRTVAPLPGEVSETLGTALATTVTVMGAESVKLPELSVAWAVTL